MRTLLGEVGGFSFCVSEFLRVSHEPPPAWVFMRHVPELALGCKTPSGLPVQLQLLGGDPERMAQAAVTACEVGASAIDINFGCPAPTVNRHDGGAVLLKCPERIEAVVRAVREAVPRPIPVSAKLRLGWDSAEPIHANAERAVRAGADWITIHGRTRVQGYAPPAHWGPIGEVRRNVGVPVVANGDIWTLEDFFRCREQTGCEHFMLGRSALADPSLARQIAGELGIATGTGAALGATAEEWAPLLRRFAVLNAESGRQAHQTLGRIKQWMKMAHLRGRIHWFDDIKRMGSLDAALGALS
jgi:tRNA-dihydrouridine synthase C